jgi:hypothetical protein
VAISELFYTCCVCVVSKGIKYLAFTTKVAKSQVVHDFRTFSPSFPHMVIR